MGINDFSFGTDNEMITCSSDRSLKVHKYDLETKTLEEMRQLNLSQFDIEGIKDNVDKQ